MPAPMAKEHAGIRVEPELLARLEAIAAELSRRSMGIVAKRSDVARVALERGAESLEKELGITEKKGAKPASKPKK
jgi:hypothetical protein